MTSPLVLDSEGLDAISSRRTPELLRALLVRAYVDDRPVLVPAVVCAEACRGASRTRRVEATLARYGRERGESPPIQVIATDFAVARQVGAILHGAEAGSEHIVDAHVVALCVPFGGGVVVTSDSADIQRLAEAVPAVKIMTTRAS